MECTTCADTKEIIPFPDKSYPATAHNLTTKASGEHGWSFITRPCPDCSPEPETNEL